jgi:hypothetical protein
MRTSAAFALLLVLLAAPRVLAAEEEKPPPTPTYNTVREYRTRVYEVAHADPRSLHDSLRLLGSGFQGASMSVNQELRTITVRDFPENLATIEEAIARLDRPAATAADVELTISVLIGAESPLSGAAVPAELAPVVRELQATLRYSHYGLLAATLHRTRAGRGIEGSGVADAALLGMTPNEERPILYRYRLREVAVTPAGGQAVVDVDDFDFSMNVPVSAGNGAIQYTPVGFRTPVTLHPHEKVVIGTTTMGDRALIVVVTAAVAPAPAAKG